MTYVPDDWMPRETNPGGIGDQWALVEIFGHRRHFGRITEVERFGAKMLRVDVPTAKDGEFNTFFYSGASLFGLTPMTEAGAREAARRDRPVPVRPRLLEGIDDLSDDDLSDDDDQTDNRRPF